MYRTCGVREAGELLGIAVREAAELRAQAIELLDEEAERAGALSDPTRLGIARTLHSTQELCVADLAWIVERPDKLVSHHLRLLRTHKIVRSRREGKMVKYSMTDRGARLLDAVLEQPGTQGGSSNVRLVAS